MLKVATKEDASEIKRMALSFYEASPYTVLKISDHKVDAVVNGFLTGSQNDKIVILSLVDDKPVGLIAGVAQEFLLNYDRIAMELMWWVDPEHRASRDSLKLIDAFEYWAKNKANCKLVQMSMINTLQHERISKVYARKGFQLAEQGYYKVL